MEPFILKHYRVFFGLLLALGLSGAFLLGRLSRNVPREGGSFGLYCSDRVLSAVKISSGGDLSQTTEDAAMYKETPARERAFLGSKNGTKYYTLGCPASLRIKQENIIWFETAEDATMQGYSAGSC